MIMALAVTGCAAAPAAPTPVDPVTAVRVAVDAVNATAGGDVAVQQQVLRRLVDPTRTAEQDACAPATITVRIDAVLDRLTPAPDDAATTAPTAATASTAPTAT
ncbi:hypothetical protein M3665_25635, partial [Bacillus licheniformis]|nr:hypothetical protein [Bacillus licheniformis]